MGKGCLRYFGIFLVIALPLSLIEECVDGSKESKQKNKVETAIEMHDLIGAQNAIMESASLYGINASQVSTLIDEFIYRDELNSAKLFLQSWLKEKKHPARGARYEHENPPTPIVNQLWKAYLDKGKIKEADGVARLCAESYKEFLISYVINLCEEGNKSEANKYIKRSIFYFFDDKPNLAFGEEVDHGSDTNPFLRKTIEDELKTIIESY